MQRQPVDVAVIANEATPYRLHVLGRIADEIPEIRLHSLFTHSLIDSSMPWKLRVEDKIRAWHDEELRLRLHRPVQRTSVPLYRRIRDYLVDHDVRLAILLGYNDLTRFLLIRWAKRAGLPLLMHTDSNVFSEGRVRGLKRVVKRRYLRWVVDSVAGLMPMGAAGRAYYRLYADHEKPTFLHPYEPDYAALRDCGRQARTAFLERHALSPDRRRFLFCGRLAAPKRVGDLIEAFTSIAGDRPGWDLVIAGEGVLRGRLERSVPGSLRERVRFLGFLQFEETAACYHSCQVLVHPSEYEPWGLIINEAVACGLAVIATDVVGAAAELVEHGVNGMIVPPRSPEALASAMAYATEGERHREMQARAAGILEMWRAQADPVEGVRAAVRHFLPGR